MLNTFVQETNQIIMNPLLKFIAILFISFSMIGSKELSAQESTVSFQIFYDDLSPYGQWINYPQFGYAWVPTAGPDFMPYSTNGYWAMSDYGWTWVSDYNWGWAPFHYGRWNHDNYYGWLWIPDNEWGPAWVSWRRSSGLYGWTPLGPNISIEMAIGGHYQSPSDNWIFVHDQYMGREDIHTYYGPRKDNQRYISNSTVINNTYIDKSRHSTYIAGPEREDVQKATGASIKSVTIREDSRPGQSMKNNQLNIYRPRVSKSDNTIYKPTKIVDGKDVKPLQERPNINPSDNTKQQQPYIRPKEGIQEKPKPDQPRNVNPPKRNDNVSPQQTPQQVSPRQGNQGNNKVDQPRNINPPKRNDNEKPQQAPQQVSPRQGNQGNNKVDQPRKINPPANNGGQAPRGNPKQINPVKRKQ